ncbi:helix-turn-helix domain-containing protein [Corynebacterium bovis]|uniref:XRE family transcriptional regulator n=1 Tax=Corynebacterium bovis TaxID=36808 RepID=A0A3R8PBL3_9CORY|nr:helix-turn-helix transcriptional regulator [Corynebacterium bovis]MDN8578287.1 helix-turn-helix transcriptional regulator [Corynebacterium bovis]RRO85746.1 XRE family transcriptional regulator [Corynebacterium bovis]RRQ06202.1 XRE family transcriptional regulator [Corynebacterium bovis]RRQ09182.1 XRE family transcriptional regulator [Corynebacterium bovis]
MKTPTLSERLALLFDTVYPGNRGPYTTSEVATALKKSGTPISPTTIKNIATGQTEKPAFQSVAALADFFGVELDFFHTTNPETWSRYEQALLAFRRQMDSDHLYAARKIADRKRHRH